MYTSSNKKYWEDEMYTDAFKKYSFYTVMCTFLDPKDSTNKPAFEKRDEYSKTMDVVRDKYLNKKDVVLQLTSEEAYLILRSIEINKLVHNKKVKKNYRKIASEIRQQMIKK